MKNFFESKRNNGIDVITVQELGLHSVCIGLYFNAGILYESKSSNGISHLIEHLYFRRLADLLQRQLYFSLESLGSTLRGKTYNNFIQFDITISPQYLRKAFDIIYRILSDFEWSLNDIDLEKNVVLKQLEYKSISFSEYVDSQYFKNLKYAMPIMGTADNISNFTPDVINKWKKRIIHTNNLCFVLTGNYSSEDFQYILNKLDLIPYRNTIELKYTEQIPVMFCKRTSRSDMVIDTENEISDISIVFDIDKHKTNPYAVDLLSSILGGGIGSKLSVVLREEYALTDEIFSRIDSYSELSKLTIEFSTNNSDLDQSLSLVFSEILKIKESISDDDLASSILFFTENRYWLLDDPQTLNFSIGWKRMGLKQKDVEIDNLINYYNNVSINELVINAHNLFTPQNLTITVTNNNGIFKTRSLKRCLSALRDKIS